MTARPSSVPRATMRLQFNKDFRFSDAIPIVPYLADLGISHLYSSPILTARAGSNHGYDVTDTSQVNPEIGGEAGLRALVSALRSSGLGIIVDIVPNHMAASHDNPFWFDVLRHGVQSRFAPYFDIDWSPLDPSLQGKILAPFLGKPYGQVLESGELKIDRIGTAPVVRYYDAIFPIDPATWHPEDDFDTSTKAGRGKLHELLERQHYRLAWWGTAADEINWRRFFDINGLVALRIERPDVFEATHQTLFRLYTEGLIDGFRVDHVDGLSDPPAYCRRLRDRLAELEPSRPDHAPAGPAYIVVEKILGAGETMPSDWNVDGTSGYDFMDVVDALQHDPEVAPALEALWASVSGRSGKFEPEETRARFEMLSWTFNGQLQALASALHSVARQRVGTRDFTLTSVRRALEALLAHFRVYRMYAIGEKRSESDETAFRHALAAAKRGSPPALHPVLDQLDIWLGGQVPDPDIATGLKIATTRFHQLSAPIAAKAVEDTAFYRYGRLLSRNDVGFNAAVLGLDADSFHEFCLSRVAAFPSALLATATHDHKRGEDVRSRLAVLTEVPGEWEAAVGRWYEMNTGLRAEGGESPISGADEFMLYQMIVGAWPNDLQPADRLKAEEFANRLGGWLEKAQREAKLFTSWTMPDASYEEASQRFLQGLFRPDHAFLEDVSQFVRRIAPAGALNGLVQAVLKMTVPGVPDFFQGTEFWDFSLVDPDNRRPVDFAARSGSPIAGADIAALAAQWRSGRIKQATIGKVLRARAAFPQIFSEGDYKPIVTTGACARNIVAFLRTYMDQHCIVVVPRLASQLLGGGDSLTIAPDRWHDTCILLPEAVVGSRVSDLFSGRSILLDRSSVPVRDLLQVFPVAVMTT